ncbi:hypothetical protein C8F04DRAFT_1197570 [Mycena alexandri]|uniref:Uncharacterized protein n=1 Tax=Mycena alexandri TaxID=1745969 RepID=A0AAD6S5Z2_9AGAR|nr:hypothetical protein C8F04DRAFT_1197570 [Mycena alexandri]
MSNRGFSQINPRAGYQTQPSPTGFNRLQPQKHFIESGKQPEPQQHEGYSLALAWHGILSGQSQNSSKLPPKKPWLRPKPRLLHGLAQAFSKPKVNKDAQWNNYWDILSPEFGWYQHYPWRRILGQGQSSDKGVFATYAPMEVTAELNFTIIFKLRMEPLSTSFLLSSILSGESFSTSSATSNSFSGYGISTPSSSAHFMDLRGPPLHLDPSHSPQPESPASSSTSPLPRPLKHQASVSGIKVLKASNWADKTFTNERSKFLNTEMAVKMHWKGVVPDKGSVEHKAYNQWQGAVYLWSACWPVVTGCPADAKSINKLIGAAWSLPQSSGH